MICSAVCLVRFLVESLAQSGRLRTLIHPGPVAGVHVTRTGRIKIKVSQYKPGIQGGTLVVGGQFRIQLRFAACYVCGFHWNGEHRAELSRNSLIVQSLRGQGNRLQHRPASVEHLTCLRACRQRICWALVIKAALVRKGFQVQPSMLHRTLLPPLPRSGAESRQCLRLAWLVFQGLQAITPRTRAAPPGYGEWFCHKWPTADRGQGRWRRSGDRLGRRENRRAANLRGSPPRRRAAVP